ncbi:MAG: box helicase [Pseudomonas sp.]|nr:box helicase [Pseudomonas sp.]
MIAVAGLGLSPGLANILAQHASQAFDELHEYHIYWVTDLPRSFPSLRYCSVRGTWQRGLMEEFWILNDYGLLEADTLEQTKAQIWAQRGGQHQFGWPEHSAAVFEASGPLDGRTVVRRYTIRGPQTWGEDAMSRGDWINDAMRILLNHVGLPCYNSGLSIDVEGSVQDTQSALAAVTNLDATALETILADVKNMEREKWDWALPPSLLMKSYASTCLDIATAIRTAKTLS